MIDTVTKATEMRKPMVASIHLELWPLKNKVAVGIFYSIKIDKLTKAVYVRQAIMK